MIDGWDWQWNKRSWKLVFGVEYAPRTQVFPWFMWVHIGPATLTLKGKQR